MSKKLHIGELVSRFSEQLEREGMSHQECATVLLGCACVEARIGEITLPQMHAALEMLWPTAVDAIDRAKTEKAKAGGAS